MPNIIFSTSTGTVNMVNLSNATDIAVPARFIFDTGKQGDGFKTSVDAVIVMSRINMGVTHQLTDTLGGDLFLTVFNNAAHQIVIDAYVFEQTCGTSKANAFVQPVLTIRNASAIPKQKGFKSLYEWWNARNVFRSKYPVQIIMGQNTTINAYLVGMQASMRDAGAGIAFWSVGMSLIGVPRRTAVSGVRSQANTAAVNVTTPNVGVVAGTNGSPQSISGVLSATVPTTKVASTPSGDPVTPTSYQITADGYTSVGSSINGFFS